MTVSDEVRIGLTVANAVQAIQFHKLLEEWVEITAHPCRYDHHGYCQEHFLHEKPCLAERTKEALGL